MAFPVTASVPMMYRWDSLQPGLVQAMKSAGIPPSNDFDRHYAWLLRVTGWSFGVDWNVQEDEISLEVPFTGPLVNLDTAIDRNDYDRVIAQDEISVIMNRCIERVPLRRLLAHFERVE